MSNVEEGASTGDNLRQKTETYFRRAIAVNKEYASIVLRSCLSQMPEAETAANLVSKCIEALAIVDDGDNIINYLQDIKTVGCEDFRLIAESLYQKLTRTEGQDLLYRIVDLYFKVYIFILYIVIWFGLVQPIILVLYALGYNIRITQINNQRVFVGL